MPVSVGMNVSEQIGLSLFTIICCMPQASQSDRMTKENTNSDY